ncbi:MAG: response regulator [Desulfuromonadales bacterium]|nr:response regulator [Desulfuromonadales bacterium]
MQKKILIVEDEESLLKLESILLTTKGYLVQGATTGLAALEAVSVEPPDLILLDIMLPELDGFEVCTRIKKNPETKHIPVILLTAKKTPEDVARGKEVGAEHYITKPFKSAMVMATIEQLLDRKTA